MATSRAAVISGISATPSAEPWPNKITDHNRGYPKYPEAAIDDLIQMMIRFRLLWAALLVDAYSFPLRAKYLGQELTKHRFSLSRQFHALKVSLAECDRSGRRLIWARILCPLASR